LNKPKPGPDHKGAHERARANCELPLKRRRESLVVLVNAVARCNDGNLADCVLNAGHCDVRPAIMIKGVVWEMVSFELDRNGFTVTDLFPVALDAAVHIRRRLEAG